MKVHLTEPQRLAALRPAVEARSRILAAIRAFFRQAGFLEVETPIRIPVPALELHIDAQAAGTAYLRTSPELHMKRLLAAGYERIFQIGACFRKGERGALHNPEYTMLEWYRAGADYLAILADAEKLVDAVAHSVGGTTIRCRGQDVNLAPPWPRLTVRDTFQRWAGWDPVAAFDPDRFDLDLVGKVEPNLPLDRPAILMDYPAEAAALARCRPVQPQIAERWELYIAGVEVANAFSELTDPAEQRRRFDAWAAARRAAGRETYPLDTAFLDALERGMPPAGGAALGVDRLVMLLLNGSSLDDVLPFREEMT